MLAAAVVSLLFLYRLAATRFGFTLLALRTRDTEALAESVGIASARHKTLAFVASCFFCGLMGAIHCHYLRFVSPFVFTFFFSTDLVIFNMVGGLGASGGRWPARCCSPRWASSSSPPATTRASSTRWCCSW